MATNHLWRLLVTISIAIASVPPAAAQECILCENDISTLCLSDGLCPDEGGEPNYDEGGPFGSLCKGWEDDPCFFRGDTSEDYVALCGCPGAEQLPGANCSFCPNGQPRGDPFITNLQLLDCEFREAKLKWNADCVDEDVGTDPTIAALCGCNNIPDFSPCKLCDDEKEHAVARAGIRYLPPGSTCRELSKDLLFIGSADSDECSVLLSDAKKVCECVRIDLCPGICPDGTVPPASDETFGFGWFDSTCTEMDALIKAGTNPEGFIDVSSPTCRGYQEYAINCQCPGVAPCLGICKGGEAPLTPNATIPDDGPYTFLQGETCDFANFNISPIDPASSDNLPEYSPFCLEPFVQESCQCPESPDLEICSVCPDGQPISNPDQYIPSEGWTCSDIERRASAYLRDSVECEVYQEVRFECGCPGAQVCPLCEDGSPVPNPSLDIGAFSGGDCEELMFLYGLLDDDDTCVAAQGVFGTYCNCPNPVADADAQICRLCGAGMLLPEPTKSVDFLGTGFDFACSDMEYFGSLPGNNCVQFQFEYSLECCGVQTPFPPLLPPSQSPDTQSPDTQSPDTQSPDTQSPDTQSPDTQSPTSVATARVSAFLTGFLNIVVFGALG